ncbi:MAG: ATP-binding protein [Desulfobacterales bacterium]|nr:ATP-binding protein [Desulfobacterales bacterium]
MKNDKNKGRITSAPEPNPENFAEYKPGENLRFSAGHKLLAGYRALFSRIGFKLIVLILCVLMLSMGSLAYLATQLMVEFGEYSVGINEQHIRKKTTLFLSRIMAEQTRRYENSFSKISLSSAVIARQAAILMDKKPFLTSNATKDRTPGSGFQPKLSFFPSNRFFSNPASDPFTVLYWGDTRISPEIKHDIALMSEIWPLLSTVKNRTPESDAVYVVTETSFTLYYPNRHMVEKLKPIQEYEIKESIWYRMARPENNPRRETVWTPVYQDEAGKGLMTSAVTPIYGKDGNFLGVAGMDITLDRMIEDILGSHAPGHDPSTGMFSFIVDRRGRIIAFPGAQAAVFGLPHRPPDIGYGNPLGQSLLDSQYAPVRNIAGAIALEKPAIHRLELEQGPMLLSSRVIPATGWHLCIATPESFILSSVRQTRQAIETAVDNMNLRFREMILIFLLICVVCIVIFLSKQVIIPLNRLIQGAGRVRDGDLSARLNPGGRDEMGRLIWTFNTMVGELEKSSIREKEQTRALEQRVRERTQELYNINMAQAHTLARLEEESRERSAIQKELEKSQARYRDIFQYAVEGIFQSTPDNRLQNANPAMARIFGFDSPEQMLEQVTDIEALYLYPEQRREFIRMVKEKRVVSGFEVQCFRKDGSVIWTSLSARAVLDPQGELLYILGSGEDITERKKADAAVKQASELAREASQAKSRFLATMSHEIRTPVNAIMGMTDLTLSTVLTPDQRKYLKVVHHSSEHLLSLIDDILDISAIEARKVEIEHQPFDPDRLITEVADMFSNAAARKGLLLSHTVKGLPRVLKGDPARLRQILANLVGNAVKFTREGSVVITAEPAPGDQERPISGSLPIRFSVRDTGIGIPENRADTIFQEFIQLENSLSRTYGGTGLGLAICKKLVDLMGGTIWVARGEPCGSIFYFSICLEPARQTDIPVSAPLRPRQTKDGYATGPKDGIHLKSCRILVAEDFQVNQDVIRPILEKQGVRVTMVSNGQKAVEAVRENQYDLVLMDIEMPVMDGLEATREIRKMEAPQKSAIPVAALTAHALKGDKERFLAAGMDGYITKPVQTGRLLQTISRLLSPGRDHDSQGLQNRQYFNPDRALSLADHDEELLLITCRSILTHLPVYLEELDRTVGQKNHKETSRLAHSIKTAAKSIGAGELADMAFELEQAGHNQNDTETIRLLQDFKPAALDILAQLSSFTEKRGSLNRRP